MKTDMFLLLFWFKQIINWLELIINPCERIVNPLEPVYSTNLFKILRFLELDIRIRFHE